MAGTPRARGRKGRWGCQAGILQRKVSSGPQGGVAHAALARWLPSLRSIPAAQQRDSPACPPLRSRPGLQSAACLLPTTASDAEVTSAFGVGASPESPPPSPALGQSPGVSPPKTVARRAPQPWQGLVTSPSRCCQTSSSSSSSSGCERRRGVRDSAPEAGPGSRGSRGSGEQLGPTRGPRSGAPDRDPSRRHLPLNIRILSMDAKVAVTLDSKSPSCTPVLRKAPADGLFSQ